MSKENDAVGRKLVWYDEPCAYCGENINSWDKRVSKAMCFTFPICESCIAEEYGMTVDYLRSRMEDRFGMRPCEGL